jgi:hypothetical protein
MSSKNLLPVVPDLNSPTFSRIEIESVKLFVEIFESHDMI